MSRGAESTGARGVHREERKDTMATKQQAEFRQGNDRQRNEFPQKQTKVTENNRFGIKIGGMKIMGISE